MNRNLYTAAMFVIVAACAKNDKKSMRAWDYKKLKDIEKLDYSSSPRADEPDEYYKNSIYIGKELTIKINSTYYRDIHNKMKNLYISGYIRNEECKYGFFIPYEILNLIGNFSYEYKQNGLDCLEDLGKETKILIKSIENNTKSKTEKLGHIKRSIELSRVIRDAIQNIKNDDFKSLQNNLLLECMYNKIEINHIDQSNLVICKLINKMNDDIYSFYFHYNKYAGTRVRNNLQKLIQIFTDWQRNI